MNRLDIFNAIRPIILSVTGVPEVILADPNAQSPQGEYVSVEPKQSLSQRGQANVRRNTSMTPQSVDVDVRAQVIVECSLNFYRGNARDRAERLLQANKRPDVSAALYRAGLGWNRADVINNLTSLQSNNFEQRAQISIFLMYETTDPITINSIESVSVSVENEKGEVLQTIEVDG